jgi:hypothetical protein
LHMIENIPVEYDEGELLQQLGVERIMGRKEEVISLIKESRGMLEPKAVYTYLKVVEVDGDRVMLENGETLKSIVLGDLLSTGQEVAPYIVTVGGRLEEEVSRLGFSNIFSAWALDIIGSYAIRNARLYLKSIVEGRLGDHVSGFDPGSGTGKLFDIKQLPTLFRILSLSSKIGVKLIPAGSMIPQKTIAGIFAATGEEYVACQYCPRDCEFRRVAYQGEYRDHHKSPV